MWNFIKLLGLSSCEITRYSQTGKQVYIQVKIRRKSAICPWCNARTTTVRSLSKVRTIKHGVVWSKECLLLVQQRRFTCMSCTKTFSEELPFVQKRQTVTRAHKKEVVFNLSDRSFSSTTKRFHVSYPTQVKWLKELVAAEVFSFQQEKKCGAPFVLGIDEVSFSGNDMVTTIGNITTHQLKGVLHSKRKDELKKVLRSIPKTVCPLISEVVIDMCTLYLKAVQETLPHTSVVVDHFHIIKDANHRIDEERRLLQEIYNRKIPRYIFMKNKEDLKESELEILEHMLKKYPELTMFYGTKERLRAMYRSKDKKEALDAMRSIIPSLTATDDGELISWGRTLSYWKPYILNYWDSKSTNAYMEGIHNKMKLIKRISFGFKNKEVFIHKVMLSVLLASVLLPYFDS